MEEEEGTDDTPQTAVAAVPVVTPGGHDTVYEATPVELWWKQMQTKVLLAIICILTAALAAGLGGASQVPQVTLLSTLCTASPSMSISASQSATERYYACFADRNELKR